MHLYMSHWTQLAQLGLGGHASAVGLHFVNFVTKFSLVEPKELAGVTELSGKFRRPQPSQQNNSTNKPAASDGQMVDNQQFLGLPPPPPSLSVISGTEPSGLSPQPNDFEMLAAVPTDAGVILQQPQSVALLLSPLENVASLKELSQLDGFCQPQVVDVDGHTDQL